MNFRVNHDIKNLHFKCVLARFDQLAAGEPADRVVYAMDMGNSLVMFNGPVPDEKPNDQRVLQEFTGHDRYCYCCGQTGLDHKKKVTKDRLLASFDEGPYEPVEGSVYPHRMLRSMVPENSVPCVMHGQCRCPAQMLAIITYRLIGVPPPPAVGPLAAVAT